MKFKTNILTLYMLLSISLTSSLTYAFDTDSPILLPDSTSTSIINSYDRRNTTTIYLEDRAVNISSISISNGNIVSYSFDKSTKRLSITVDNGSINLIPNPKKYKKTGTKTLDSLSTSFNSTTYYSDSDDYTGVINKSGAYYKNTTLSTPASSKTISDYNTDSSNVGINKGDANDSSSHSAMISKVKSKVMANRGWNTSNTISYNSDGYSGTLKASITAEAAGMVPVDVYPTLPKGTWRGSVTVTRSFSGTVTKPAVNWYSQKYSGTVYAPGEDEVYTYYIYINYKKMPLPPNTPQIITPSQSDNLYFATEVIPLTWSYSDPEGMALIASRITLTNVITGIKYNFDIPDNKKLHFLPAIFPQGAYNLTVSVKNDKNMISTSNSILIRRNVYRKPGRLVTKNISCNNEFRKIKIVTQYELENKFVNGKKILTSIDGYILLPTSYSNNQYIYDYNTTDPNYKIKFKLENNFDFSDVILLPKPTKEMKILFVLDSEDNEFSEISPALDNITVYAR